MKIIQLSDLHVRKHTWSPSREHRDVLERWERIVEEVNAEKAGAIVITGDVTDDGFLGAYEKAAEVLKELRPKPIAVPGNHDARYAGMKLFNELINEVPFAKTVAGVTFIGLNSTLPDLDEGMIGESQLKWFEQQLEKHPGTKIVLLHHHLLPVPHTGRERNILFDAGDVLTAVIKHDVQLVLSGHRHQHNSWLIEKTAVVNAGTTASDKLMLYNFHSYNVIVLEKESVLIQMKNVGGEKVTLAHYAPQKLSVCRIE